MKSLGTQFTLALLLSAPLTTNAPSLARSADLPDALAAGWQGQATCEKLEDYEQVRDELIARFKAIGDALKLTVATYGHVGDGNLHTNVLHPGPQHRSRVDEALAQIMRVTVELGGTISGEHGVGLSKKQFLHLEQSPALIELQRRLKVHFDPQVILNPGKVFPDGENT